MSNYRVLLKYNDVILTPLTCTMECTIHHEHERNVHHITMVRDLPIIFLILHPIELLTYDRSFLNQKKKTYDRSYYQNK